MLTEHLGDGAAQAADDSMVFGGDDFARLVCGGDDRFFVERFDRRHVQDVGRNALAGEGIGGIEAARCLRAGGNQCDEVLATERSGTR